MAIAIRSETTGGTTTAADGTFSVTKPSSVSNGDYLVVVIGKQDDPDIAPPGDWTTGNEGGSATGNDRFGGIYYKKITNAAGEGASYTFDSAGASEPVGWWIGALSGVDPDTPQDVAFSGTGAWAALANDTSPNCPAVTTVTNGAFALACWAINTDSSVTMPGGSWADRAVNVGGNGVLSVASQTFPTAGTSTGTPEVTNVDTGMESEVGMFVFRPDVPRSVNKSETVGSTDTPTVATLLSAGISKSETVGTTDTPTALLVSFVSKSETVGSTDTPTVAAFLSAGISKDETVGTTDTPTASVSSPQVSKAEAVSVTDTPTVTLGTEPPREASTADNVTVTDSLGTYYPDTVWVEEVVIVQIAALQTLEASVSDTVGSSDAPTVGPITASVSKSETVGTSESTTLAVSSPQISKDETVGTSENVDVDVLEIGQLTVSKSEDVAVSESKTVSLFLTGVSKSETVGTTESTTTRIVTQVSKSETVGTSESTTLVVGTSQVSKTETVGTSESTTLAVGRSQISKSETVGTTDSVTIAMASLTVTVSDSIGVSDVVVVAMTYVVLVINDSFHYHWADGQVDFNERQTIEAWFVQLYAWRHRRQKRRHYNV